MKRLCTTGQSVSFSSRHLLERVATTHTPGVIEKYRGKLEAKPVVRFALIWSDNKPIEINDVTYPGPA